jgi:hypothetical protein
LILADPLKKKEAVYQRFDHLLTTIKILVLFLLTLLIIDTLILMRIYFVSNKRLHKVAV